MSGMDIFDNRHFVCFLSPNNSQYAFDTHAVAISFNVMEDKVEFLVFVVGPQCIPLLRDLV